MIVIKLRGGLANQMFQYALGRKLNHLCNEPVVYDLIHYTNEQTTERTVRAYGLDVFNIEGEIATPEQILKGKGWYVNPIHRKFNTLLNRNRPYFKQNIVKEQSPSFDKNIFKIRKDCYLQGFWQSENYFNDIEKIIRQDFTFKKPCDLLNQKHLDQVKKSKNPVSVHVRRGDYINNQHYANIHMVLTQQYYQEATNYIESKIYNPTYFVFSDDIEWAQSNLHFKHQAFFMSHNGSETAYEDLRLMKSCSHNIIANSSFSWWGAWLNENKEKVVIAPQRWYKQEDMENKDIIPQDWKVIYNE